MNEPTDHLGTPIEPGSVLCYSYGSPTNARNQMYYGVVHQMVKGEDGKPVIRVRSIPSKEQMDRQVTACREYVKTWGQKNPTYAANISKRLHGMLRRSTFKGRSFTVVDPNKIPAGYREGLEELQKLEQMGHRHYYEQY